MLHGKRGNPDVIVGNRAALGAQFVLEPAINAGGLFITKKHCVCLCEIVYCLNILRSATGIIGPVVKFAQHNLGKINA